MRLLQGEEIEEANNCFERAVEIAMQSRCQKSKRGIVIVESNLMIGQGCNNPPLNIPCVPEQCYGICNQYNVHAEENAILDALKKKQGLEGSRMYHVKVKEGELTPTGGPSCLRCSALVLQVGIAEFALQQKEGYVLYEAREFHELSLQSLRR